MWGNAPTLPPVALLSVLLSHSGPSLAFSLVPHSGNAGSGSDGEETFGVSQKFVVLGGGHL